MPKVVEPECWLNCSFLILMILHEPWRLGWRSEQLRDECWSWVFFEWVFSWLVGLVGRLGIFCAWMDIWLLICCEDDRRVGFLCCSFFTIN